MPFSHNDLYVELILLILFAFNVVIQLFYYWYFFARLAFRKIPEPLPQSIPVSVVISAKNEYTNLKRHLPLILDQDYPDFEVVLVDDASTDESDELLDEMDKQYERLKVIHIRQDLNFFKGKKFPLSIGIKSAKNDLILLTDADCRPASRNWIKLMASRFIDQTEVVLGYGPFEKRKGLLNKLIRFDCVHVAMQYLSYALRGIPYMGVGRNLAYKKALFYQSKGFTSHYKVASGDDDLFISQVARAGNTGINIHPGAFMYSRPSASLGRWIRQKRRHFSTAGYYKKQFKGLLGLYSASQLSFYILFVLSLVFPFYWPATLFLFLLRIVSQGIILKKCSNKLDEKDLLLFSPIYELMLILMSTFLVLTNFMRKRNKWK